MRQNPEIYDLYDRLSKHAVARSQGDGDALARMIGCASSISPTNCLGVVRAFTQMLNLVNAAEVHHRVRILRESDKQTRRVSPLPMIDDSVAGTLVRLLEEAGTGTGTGAGTGDDKDTLTEVRKQEIFRRLLKQQVDIVMTAHPTEVNRRTLLLKYRRISELLAELDSTDLTRFERAQATQALKRQIASIWGSDEIRRQRPTPQQEARGGLAILESVLWDAVPSYLRKFSLQCSETLGPERSLPLTHVPIKFSSWMGGDRDGNPSVTPHVTMEVAVTQRLQVAKLILVEVVELYKELAICKGFSEEVLQLARAVPRSFDRRELYRRILGHMRSRLLSTIQWCEAQLVELHAAPNAADVTSAKNILEATTTRITSTDLMWGAIKPTDQIGDEPGLDLPVEQDEKSPSPFLSLMGRDSEAYFDAEDLIQVLSMMHSSLTTSGFSDVADGRLADLIRRIATFGLTLVPLDIRQESTRHAKTLDEITQYLELGSYLDWDEDQRIDWLETELKGKRPLFRVNNMHKLGFSADVMDTLNTLRTASNLGPGSLGAYVISQARSCSDVLAVQLLQKQFGMTAESGKLMRVVPLFETLTDLNNAPDIVERLFRLKRFEYLKAVDFKQEIMVGYSDSAKDAGRLAACWAQYTSQEKMGQVAQQYGVDITFFHGKGGTVGRGGNPALYRAVLAHPPNTVNGKFRVTEQGEMITQNFGSPGIAERTLDIYTAAVLAEGFTDHVEPSDEWRAAMDALSDLSCAQYRSLLRDPCFIAYFRTATPELELGRLNIGSRPSKRNPKGGIESLRAIPWTFAWTQTRLNLPAWLGVGAALSGGSSSGGGGGFDDKKKSQEQEQKQEGGAGTGAVDSSSTLPSVAELQKMYTEWPYFREMIDLIGMTLSKTDYSISANYELQLLPPSSSNSDNAPKDSDSSATTGSSETSPEQLRALGVDMREQLVDARKGVLKVTGCDDLSSGFQLLQQSMRVRYPYVDPLNVLQAEIMRRLRQNAASDDDRAGSLSEEDRLLLEDSMVVSINGIAQGMKNSG